MAAEEIITIFKAEVESYKKGVLEIQKQLSGLQEEQKKTTQETEKLNKKFADTGKAVETAFKGNSISRELKNIQKEMQGLDAGSKKFNELAQKAGQLKDQINDAKEATKAFSSESKASTAKNLFTQIGYDIAQLDFKGASEKAKQFASVIKGISFSEVVSGLKNFGSTLVSIGKAIASNPFVILATAVAALGYALYDVIGSFKDMDKQAETTKSGLDRMKQSIDGLVDAYGAMIIQQQILLGKITESQGKVLTAEMKYNKMRVDESKKFNDEVTKLAEELGVDLKDLQNGRLSESYAGDIKDMNNRIKFNKQIQQLEKEHTNVLKQITKNSVLEVSNVKLEEQKKAKEKEDAEKEKEKQRLKEYLKEQNRLQKEELEFRNKLQEDYNKQSKDIQKEYYARLKKDREDADAEANKSRLAAIKARDAAEIQALKERHDIELQMEEKYKEATRELKDAELEYEKLYNEAIVQGAQIASEAFKLMFKDNAAASSIALLFEKTVAIFQIVKSLQIEKAAYYATAAELSALTPPLAATYSSIAVAKSQAANLRAGLSIATIAAQTIPQLKFAKGTKSVEGGIRGQDSVSALLMPEEMVIPVKTKKKYEPLLNAIFDHRISAAQANAIAKAGSKGTTGENMVNNYSMNGIRYDEIANAGKWANRDVVRELRILRRDIKQGVSSKLNRRYGA